MLPGNAPGAMFTKRYQHNTGEGRGQSTLHSLSPNANTELDESSLSQVALQSHQVFIRITWDQSQRLFGGSLNY